ncbi:AAA family ATPase [Sphaerotilus sp.]|uniref:AAA family ATPase n=1 Tax=Sphaerotilus sp. TaxID=2093942 RepID=UPI002ACECC8D|nr:AAA family ATPase [Sphaerotilus sp.]MDZ7859041.1 AAA family ATPase [Sphaerotilus sp.]
MLTRLEIDGFKSFEGLAIDLAPFTAILGNNAAGKSNLFDAIQLLAALATHDVAEAVKALRGEPLELFRLTPGGRVKRMTLAVEVLLDPIGRDPWGSEVKLTHTRMRYEVTLERRETRPGIERIQVAHEAVNPIFAKDDKWAKALAPSAAFRKQYLQYKRQKPWLTTDDKADGQGREFNIHQDGTQGRLRPASAAEATVLYSITNAEFPHLFALREEMRQWRLLQLDPALLRRPAPVTAADTLTADGANLAAVLARMKAETATDLRPHGVLSDIAAELNHLIPGVTRLDVFLHDASREYRIELTMRDGLPFTSRVISDGTLRVLALLTLLHDPKHRGLVCFEEPENGVHPGRVKTLVQRLQDMVSRPRDGMDAGVVPPLSQLLLNSHSPVVLAALLDSAGHPVDEGGAILFADTSSVTDPAQGQTRRRTRLRPIRQQDGLFASAAMERGAEVSDLEVRQVLDAVRAEG